MAELLKRNHRPYDMNERMRLAELIQQHGARGAREVVSRQVSVTTLLKIAREFGITLKRGKRPRRNAA